MSTSTAVAGATFYRFGLTARILAKLVAGNVAAAVVASAHPRSPMPNGGNGPKQD